MTGAELIGNLDYESASILLDAVFKVLGVAYLFRQALRFIGNKI